MSTGNKKAAKQNSRFINAVTGATYTKKAAEPKVAASKEATPKKK